MLDFLKPVAKAKITMSRVCSGNRARSKRACSRVIHLGSILSNWNSGMFGAEGM